MKWQQTWYYEAYLMTRSSLIGWKQIVVMRHSNFVTHCFNNLKWHFIAFSSFHQTQFFFSIDWLWTGVFVFIMSWKQATTIIPLIRTWACNYSISVFFFSTCLQSSAVQDSILFGNIAIDSLTITLVLITTHLLLCIW